MIRNKYLFHKKLLFIPASCGASFCLFQRATALATKDRFACLKEVSIRAASASCNMNTINTTISIKIIK